MRTSPLPPIRRIDDSTALVDHVLAHLSLFVALGIAVLAVFIPAMRRAVEGACVVGIAAAVRLALHPLRFAGLSRVYVGEGRVFVASLFGRAREVEVVRVEHDGHSPWPCVLHLANGRTATFVARRDTGLGALFDMEISDKARYVRPSDARDSLASIETIVRRR